MTQKYESVLSEQEVIKLETVTKLSEIIRATEQAVLAKLQPQLDAIGAGGVSGQKLRQARVPEGYKIVPIEATSEQIDSALCSKAADDEGEFPMLLDILDFSGDNKSRTVINAAYKAMLAASPEPSND